MNSFYDPQVDIMASAADSTLPHLRACDHAALCYEALGRLNYPVLLIAVSVTFWHAMGGLYM